MEVRDRINIAKDFSNVPGARYSYEGPYSGEVFLRDILRPKLQKAIEQNYILLIELDGVIGYPSSFISGSFGVLSREFGAKSVLQHIQFAAANASKIQKFNDEIRNPQTRERTK